MSLGFSCLENIVFEAICVCVFWHFHRSPSTNSLSQIPTWFLPFRSIHFHFFLFILCFHFYSSCYYTRLLCVFQCCWRYWNVINFCTAERMKERERLLDKRTMKCVLVVFVEIANGLFCSCRYRWTMKPYAITVLLQRMLTIRFYGLNLSKKRINIVDSYYFSSVFRFRIILIVDIVCMCKRVSERMNCIYCQLKHTIRHFRYLTLLNRPPISTFSFSYLFVLNRIVAAHCEINNMKIDSLFCGINA